MTLTILLVLLVLHIFVREKKEEMLSIFSQVSLLGGRSTHIYNKIKKIFLHHENFPSFSNG